MEKILFFFGLLAVVAADSSRVEFKLINFTSAGTLHDGDKCDIGTHCDPRLKGYVDTEKPDVAWPGPLPMEKWALIYEGKDIKDTARLGKIVSRDYCDTPFKKANLRVQVDDVDPSRIDKMEQFICMSGRDVGRNEQFAPWSPVKSCDAHHDRYGNKLMYSWRAYPISRAVCGKAK